MKAAILALSIFTTPALAGVIHSIPNEVGGKILFTDVACEGGGFVVLAYAKDTNQARRGCWATLDGDLGIWVTWEGGGVSRFEVSQDPQS